MAIPVARVHLAMANAALPGLLPTPPKNAIFPAACVTIFPIKPKLGRADAAERWDAHKTRPSIPSSSSSSASSSRSASSSPGPASSCDRWDSNKKCPSSTASRAPSSGKKKPESNSKRPVSRSSSAERWDLHKKPRAHGDAGMGSGGDKETVTDKLLPLAIYGGPGFIKSPEPCMLPIPSFMVRAR